MLRGKIGETVTVTILRGKNMKFDVKLVRALIEVPTAANIDKSWINVKVEDLFSKVTGQKVFVANDADVAGLAELTFGAVKDYKGPVLFLTIGTGIGSALFINGQMYPNTEFGHIKFKGDIAEHYCSDAVRERVDLMGYTPWGFIDVVSAGTGEMRKRYGFIYVDMDDEGKGTMARSRKDSFFWYKKVIASNGADLTD